MNQENPYAAIARGLTTLIEQTQTYSEFGRKCLEFGQLRIALLQEIANLALDIAEFDNMQPMPLDHFDRINLRGRIQEIGALADAAYSPQVAVQAPAPRQQVAYQQPQQPAPPGHRAPYYGPARQEYQMRDVLDRAATEPAQPLPQEYYDANGYDHAQRQYANGHYPPR